jgi:hypothetical protein
MPIQKLRQKIAYLMVFEGMELPRDFVHDPEGIALHPHYLESRRNIDFQSENVKQLFISPRILFPSRLHFSLSFQMQRKSRSLPH